MRIPFVLVYFVFMSSQIEGSQADAERITRSYELANETLALKLKLATTDAEKQALWEKRPDAKRAAQDLWQAISPALAEEWTIPHACFFLNLTRSLTAVNSKGVPAAIFVNERKMVIDTFAKNHIRRPGIGAFAVALADQSMPQSLPMLERIIEENPDPTTQGVAAMAAALVLRGLGDTPELLAKRLTHIRTAIIQAADQKIGETSIADMAANELYIIKNLSKGRSAPDFTGTDVAGRTIRLSESRGKVTVILFWDAKSQDTDRVIDLTNELVIKNTGKPVNVIGITPESLQRIRELQADGSIRWNNIIDPAEKISNEYRINSRPFVFVLDQKGTIEYTGTPGSFVDLTIDALLAAKK